MMKWIDKIIGRLCPDRQPAGPVLEIDASIIRCRFPNGLIQQLMWDKLKAVIIETNDKGPFEEDVYFLLRCRIQRKIFAQYLNVPRTRNPCFLDFKSYQTSTMKP
jgi:hypothetical protein